MSIDINDQMINFSALTDTGVIVHGLDLIKSNYTLIYFYPKDNTSGCTQQSCAFRDKKDLFDKLNCSIVGVSRDSVKSHIKFKDKYQLPFVLISDEDEKICTIFDTLKEKSMYGRKYLGIERSTFIIDKSAKLRAVWRKVKVAGHVDEVINKLQDLTENDNQHSIEK